MERRSIAPTILLIFWSHIVGCPITWILIFLPPLKSKKAVELNIGKRFYHPYTKSVLTKDFLNSVDQHDIDLLPCCCFILGINVTDHEVNRQKDTYGYYCDEYLKVKLNSPKYKGTGADFSKNIVGLPEFWRFTAVQRNTKLQTQTCWFASKVSCVETVNFKVYLCIYFIFSKPDRPHFEGNERVDFSPTLLYHLS